MSNTNLHSARRAKNDEFYTQYEDIEKEMNAYLAYNPDVFRGQTLLLPCDDPEWSNFTKYFAQRFQHLGLKKLISTSYAPNSKPEEIRSHPTLFEMESPQFSEEKSHSRGKIFTLTRDISGNGVIDWHDLEWTYLEGDGDFRSPEVTALRDEADIVITNPPFSLFRDYMEWLLAGKVKFAAIGSINAITYKEIFPLIKANKMWMGSYSGSKTYKLPDGSEEKMGNTCWFTNIEHGKRHEPLTLLTMEDNLRFNKYAKENGYPKYDNYDAIEVGRVQAIPSDYKGVMGVPITFLEKYNPDQFEIVGSFNAGEHGDEIGAKKLSVNYQGKKLLWNGPLVDSKPLYKRILIRRRGLK